MSNYSALKTAIQQAVYTNGNNEITGAGLQSVLLQIVNTVGDGYVFKGVATAGTAPGTPDANVFYIAPAGTYTNFGSSYTVTDGSLGLFMYNGTWSKSQVLIDNGKRNQIMTINGNYGNEHVSINKIYRFNLVTSSWYSADINKDFFFGAIGTASEFLVWRNNDTVANVVGNTLRDDDIILLAWSRDRKDFYGGTLYDEYIYYKTLNAFTTIPISWGEKNVAINSQGVKISTSTTTPYWITMPIFLKAGTKVSLNARGMDFSPLARWNENGTYTPIVTYNGPSTAQNFRRYVATIPSDGMYVITSTSINNDLGNVLNVSEAVNMPHLQTIAIALENKAVNNNGVVISTTPPAEGATAYCISKPFYLKSGDTLHLSFHGYQLGVLSKYDHETDTYAPVVTNINTPTNSDYLFEADYLVKERGVYVYSGKTDAVIKSTRKMFYVEDVNFYLTPVRLASKGYKRGALTNSDIALKAFSSDTYISFDATKDYFEIDTELGNGEVLEIFAFANDFTFLASAEDISDLPASTKYIKFNITNTSAYSYKKKVLSIRWFGRRPVSVKIDPKDYGTQPNTPTWLSYEVNNPAITAGSGTAYVGNDNQRCWTNGYVVMPPNYTRDGAPVPLIILAHGTNCYKFAQTTLDIYSEVVPFLSKNGFAVADCSSLSSLYYSVSGISDANIPTQLAKSCYIGLVDTICRTFNVDRNNIFMVGHSAGGMLTNIFAVEQPFPLRAVASMAGSTDLYLNMRVVAFPANHKYLFEQFGLDSSVLPNVDRMLKEPINATAKAAYLANAEAFVGYNPLTFNCVGINNAELWNRILSDTFPNGFESDAALEAIINNGYKMLPVPMKIWQAVDDANVPIAANRFLKKMVDKAGGVCVLREYPSGTGQHGCNDVSELAPRTDYVTKFGETVNITVSYAELVDWFNGYMK